MALFLFCGKSYIFLYHNWEYPVYVVAKTKSEDIILY